MAEVAVFEGQWDWSLHSMNHAIKAMKPVLNSPKISWKLSVYWNPACIASLAIIACGLVAFLILHYKDYREFVYRLVLYLMAPDILESLHD